MTNAPRENARSENARKLGLIPVSLGAGILLWILGFVLHVKAVDTAKDLIGGYYSAHCLLHHRDPYDPGNVLDTFRAEGGEHPMDDELTREITSRYLYPPSAFAVVVPLALLPWSVAKVVWAVGSVCSLIVAGFLVLDLCAGGASVLGGVFIGYLLATSYVLVVLSNPSELAIGLSIIAAWCFLRERYAWAGIVCLAASLVVKPQIAGLAWLCFLLAGGMFRRRALQTLLVAVVVSLPFVLWVWRVAPNWNAELRSNVDAFSVRGGATDPGPSSKSANDLVDLQVMVSRVWDRPDVYNAVSYVVVAPLLVAWAVITIRRRGSPGSALYGLAAISPLSLLPVYHHVYDAKLLLLTVPALTLVWVRRDRASWPALLLTGVSFVLLGDTTHRMVMKLTEDVQGLSAGAASVINSLALCAAPLSLLAIGVFYTWVFWRGAASESQSQF
jgi:hypothetical protein